MNFRKEIVILLTATTQLSQEEVEKLLAVPPDPTLGDYAFPCFILGKTNNAFAKNPKEAAEQLKVKLESSKQESVKFKPVSSEPVSSEPVSSELPSTELKLPAFIAKTEVVGPYLNFFINQQILAETTLKAIYREAKHYGQPKKQEHKNKKIVVEYCGPNTNKPLHLGHIRNMALGNTVCRILSFVGNNVHPVNIINDRGVHICQSMLAYQKWGKGRDGKEKEPDKKGDHFVGDFYVLFAQAVKEEEKKAKEEKNIGKEILKKEAQELLLKWELGDKETRALWKKMNSWVLQGFTETYRRFGVSFEKEYSESDYYQQGKEVVQEGLKKGIFQRDPATSAIIAPLKQFDLPDKVLLRGDDTSIYITQDMYLSTLRYKDFKFQQMIYVVASEQRLHFQQLFKILELLGKKYAKDMHHLSYGLVNLPSGRMKSREGTVVDADDIMNEVAALAKKEITQRHKDIPEKEIHQRAEAIALAAIKFFMLQTDAVRDIVYNPEESLSFEGETGPYLQYTHARACSILRKAKEEHNLTPNVHIDFSQLQLPSEFAVIRQLYNFPEVILKTAESYKPHLLCHALLSLAQAFNEFYHQCPVLSDEEINLSKARLLLVDCVRQVLANGLNLLGIKALEEM